MEPLTYLITLKAGSCHWDWGHYRRGWVVTSAKFEGQALLCKNAFVSSSCSRWHKVDDVPCKSSHDVIKSTVAGNAHFRLTVQQVCETVGGVSDMLSGLSAETVYELTMAADVMQP